MFTEVFVILGDKAIEFGDGFELWLVGDLVNRGPHNLRPLRVVRPWAPASFSRVEALWN